MAQKFRFRRGQLYTSKLKLMRHQCRYTSYFFNAISYTYFHKCINMYININTFVRNSEIFIYIFNIYNLNKL